MQNKPYFLFRIFECFVLINKSFDWLINIISYDQKSFDLNKGQKKIKTIFLKLKKERWRRFKLISEADLESLSSKSESTKYEKEHINMAECLPCMGQSEEQESDLESYPLPHELDSILCQNFVL